MRHVLLILFVFGFMACGGDGAATNDTNVSTPAPATTATPSPVAVKNTKNIGGPIVDLQDGINAKAENPNIQVTVNGLNAGPAYLIGFYTGQQFRADSTSIAAGGRITLKRDKPYISGLYYLVFSDNTNIQMMIDEDQTFKMTTQRGNLVGAMTVEGSTENELLYKNLKFEREHRQIIEGLKAQAQTNATQKDLISAQIEDQIGKRTAHLNDIFTNYPNAFFTSFKRSGQNPDVTDVFKPGTNIIDTTRRVWLYRTQFWDNVNFNDERLLATPVISNKLKKYITELTQQQPDSIFSSAKYLVDQVLDNPEYFKYFANWIVIEYDPQKSTLMDPQAVYVNMIENYFTKERAFWSNEAEIYGLQQRAYEMSASLMGKKGPDVISTDPTGKTKSIYELKDPYVVVYMYNPDCEHCEKETPKLVQFYHQWKPKGVDVYAIAIDTDDKKWKDYIKKNNMPWASNVHDPTNKSIYAKYFVDLTPEIYVLNPDRTIIGKNLKVDQIETIINRDMKKRR